MSKEDCVVCFNEGFVEEQILYILRSWIVCKKHKEEMVELKFGKYKGQTISEVSKTQEGIQYLEWLKRETKPTGKYAEANKKLLSEIESVLKTTTQYIPDSQERKPMQSSKPSEALDLLKKIYADIQAIKYEMGIADVKVAVKEEDSTPF